MVTADIVRNVSVKNVGEDQGCRAIACSFVSFVK
jgi:hypothetical protein